jgi:hypothetical protein
MKPPSPPRTITATRVMVRPGVIIWRVGRAWVGGEVLVLAPDDADRLVRRGAVQRA